MALKEVAAYFGIKVDDAQLKRADKGIEDFIGKLQEMGRALIGGTAAIALFRFADHLSTIGDGLDKTAIRLGVGTDALQQLQFAAGQSGVGAEGLTNALLKLQDTVGDALINPAGEGAKALQRLGLSAKDSAGNVKDAGVLLEDVAEKVEKAETPAKKIAIATDAFGRAGRELLPLLAEGRDGIRKLREEQEALGGGFSKDGVEAARNYNDALGRLNVTFLSIKSRLAVAFLPILQRVVDGATKAISVFLELSKKSAIFEGALAAVATVLAVKLAPAFLSLLKTLAPFAIPLAIITGITLVVDELITLFRGGKTVIGDFIDSFAGLGTTERIVRSLKQTFDDLFQGVRDGIELVRLFTKSKGGFRMDLLNTEELLGLNRIARRADERAGTTGNGTKGFLPLMANGRGAAIQQAGREVGQRTNPTVPAFLSRAFVSQPTAKPGTVISAPTSVQVTLGGGGATEQDRLLLQTFLEDLLDKKARDVKAALVPAVPR